MNFVKLTPVDIEIPDILYKYREVNKNSLSSLLCNQVYFSQPQHFNDPFEPEKIFGDSQFGGALAKTVTESGILCLCRDANNLSMWSYYASALKGFAIGYKNSKLLESIAPNCWKYVYEVSYEKNEITAINENMLIQTNYNEKDPEKIKMFATKADVFSHENEIRIVIEPHLNSAGGGFGLYDHDPDAISHIILGELTPENDEKAIRAALHGRDIVFNRAVRSKNEFKIKIMNA